MREGRRSLIRPLQEPLTLRAGFAWALAANVVYAVSQWGILTVLAKLGSADMVGRFSLGLAVTAPVMLFSGLHLRAIQATDARDEYAFGDYVRLRLLTTSLALLAICGIVLAFGYRAEAASVILAVGLAKAFESISDVIHGLLQKRERMDRIAISLLIKGPLSLAALGLLVWISGSVVAGTLGLAASWLVVLLMYDRSSARRLGFTWASLDSRTLWRLTRLTLPMGFVTMLISLNANLPRYFVEQSWGEEELGYFSAMAYLIPAGNAVVSALGQSVSARLATCYADGRLAGFRRLLLRLVGVASVLGVAGMLAASLAGEEILTLLYRREYAEHADVFVLLMMGACIAYVASILGYGMTAARHLRAQTRLFALVTAVTASLCFWLIPTGGLRGAAVALIVSNIVQAGGSLVIIARALQAPGERPEA